MGVTQLSKEDQDLIKMPSWVFKTLSMAEGQPACVSLPKWPGSLHFYDAQTVELIPMSPSYYTIVERFSENPRALPNAI